MAEPPEGDAPCAPVEGFDEVFDPGEDEWEALRDADGDGEDEGDGEAEGVTGAEAAGDAAGCAGISIAGASA